MAVGQQILPEVIDGETGYRGRYMAVIFDNAYNTFAEVVRAISEATGCGLEEAYIETWEAHTYGRAPIHFASQGACCAVASIISRIGVRTEVRPEWEE
ncbi:MAG: ATP-dependent Clp protease adaptor ClpS [Armatimonadetes bacterium]|nr:ATP-dependent Clp protease adaptor ClpS [Armatimonadota bacterium]